MTNKKKKSAIFKKTTESRGNTVLVGVHMPLEYFQYVNLYTLVNRIPKNKLLLDLFTDWITKTKQQFPESELIAVMKKTVWKAYSAKTTIQDRREFLKDLQMELTKKKIPVSTITMLINYINEAKKENNENA